MRVALACRPGSPPRWRSSPAAARAENAEAMDAALAQRAHRRGRAGRARRRAGRFRAGDAVGFVEEEIVAWGEPEATLRDVLERARPTARSS